MILSYITDTYSFKPKPAVKAVQPDLKAEHIDFKAEQIEFKAEQEEIKAVQESFTAAEKTEINPPAAGEQDSDKGNSNEETETYEMKYRKLMQKIEKERFERELLADTR